MTILDLIGLPFVDRDRHLTDWGRTPLVPPPDSRGPCVLFVDEITMATAALASSLRPPCQRGCSAGFSAPGPHAARC